MTGKDIYIYIGILKEKYIVVCKTEDHCVFWLVMINK